MASRYNRFAELTLLAAQVAGTGAAQAPPQQPAEPNPLIPPQERPEFLDLQITDLNLKNRFFFHAQTPQWAITGALLRSPNGTVQSINMVNRNTNHNVVLTQTNKGWHVEDIAPDGQRQIFDQSQGRPSLQTDMGKNIQVAAAAEQAAFETALIKPPGHDELLALGGFMPAYKLDLHGPGVAPPAAPPQPPQAASPPVSAPRDDTKPPSSGAKVEFKNRSYVVSEKNGWETSFSTDGATVTAVDPKGAQTVFHFSGKGPAQDRESTRHLDSIEVKSPDGTSKNIELDGKTPLPPNVIRALEQARDSGVSLKDQLNYQDRDRGGSRFDPAIQYPVEQFLMAKNDQKPHASVRANGPAGMV